MTQGDTMGTAPHLPVIFWTNEDGGLSPFVGCLGRDLEALPTAEAIKDAFGNLHEGDRVFYFIETDGGFRIVQESRSATCVLQLFDGSTLLQFAAAWEWASIALRDGYLMMIVAQDEAALARAHALDFDVSPDETGFEKLCFCASAAS